MKKILMCALLVVGCGERYRDIRALPPPTPPTHPDHALGLPCVNEDRAEMDGKVYECVHGGWAVLILPGQADILP